MPGVAAMAQTQTDASLSSSVTQFTCLNLTRNLSISMTGEDVKDLKHFLALNTLYAPTYGGMYNNMFDLPTKRALIMWQVRQNIFPANGIAGRNTRNKIKMVTCPVIVSPKSADLNGDGKVTTADLTILGNILNSKAVDVDKDNDFSHTFNSSKYDLNNDGKINLADLAIINNQIPTTIRADVNSDGVVDTKDITFFNTFIGTSIGDQYAPADDMNADGKVDAADIPLFKAAYDLVVKPIIMPAISGDVNNDGVVNQLDLDLVKAAMNTKTGDAAFNPACDLNGDGRVTISDVAILKLKIQMQAADLNGDGKVTTADITILGNALNVASSSSMSYNPKFDLNNDGKVDLADLAELNRFVPANIRADVNSDGVVDTKDIVFFNTFLGTSIGDGYMPTDDMNADGKVDATDIPLYKTAYSNK